MLLRVVLAIALCACSSKKSEEPPARFAIVPDKLLNQLGEFGTGIALDFRALDVGKLTGYLPDSLGCARDLLKTAHVGVITLAGDSWEGRITGVDETQGRACLVKLAPALDLDPAKLDLAWQGDEAMIGEKGHEHRSGAPPLVIEDLLAKVPHTAKAWLVSSGFPQFKIDRATAWLDTTPDTWTFTIDAAAVEQGAARPWIEAVVVAFKRALVAKGAHVDDHWFTIESTAMTAKLVARIPVAEL